MRVFLWLTQWPRNLSSILSTTSIPSRVSLHQDILPVAPLEQKLPDGVLPARSKEVRRYSDQDILTRQTRASLRRTTPNHRSSASYPFYTPTTALSGSEYASKPPFLPWGAIMEAPRLYRPASGASSRSSFESRHKSPLSISSSADYDSSSTRTSVESSYSDPSTNSKYITMRAAVPAGAFGGRRPSLVDPAVPSLPRYGAGGQGKQQATLITPQRMAKRPSSPTKGIRYTPRIPGDGFKKLPEEILLVILGELRKSHLEVGSLSCATCYMRDLINVGATGKKWWSAAQHMLYEDIQLNGCDFVLHTKKKYKIKYGTRLILLRRTLRARPDLASYVKSLKVPSLPDAAKSKKEQDGYLDLVASVIMACPNLERLPGLYPAYNHTFSRLTHALSTRTQLKEAIWVINPSPFQRQRRYNITDDDQTITELFAPGFLLPEQCIDFLTNHSNWTHLKTLFLHCNPGGTIDSLLFADVCNQLPLLENLHVSAFPAPAFNDSTLATLPPLKSLRLDNLPGVTASGLSTYACLPSSANLVSLSLISLPLLSLPVLPRIFSHLRKLTHFTLSQAPSPSLPIGTDIFLHPYLASASLEYLHWEITNPDDDNATDILSKSILHGGFLALRTIRAPTDFDGALQKLCRPRERIELPGDRYRNLGQPGQLGLPSSQSMPIIPSPTRSTFSLGHTRSDSMSSMFIKSPTRSAFSLNIDQSHPSDEFDPREKGMSLVMARRMAQRRIDSAISQPNFHIIVWNAEGQFVERQTVGGYMGMVQSKIFYSLRPDIDGMDEAVVTMDGIGGLLDGGEETNVRDGCTGSWNLNITVQGRSGRSGSGKEKWWHTERGRWREVPLEKFF